MRGDFAELDGHDAYELLGITPNASPEEIKRAHLTLVRRHHPDQFQDARAKAEGAEHTRLINAARDVLLDHRASYDAARRPPEPEEIIEDPWDTATAGAPRPGPWTTTAPGPPHRYHPPGPRHEVGSKLRLGCTIAVLTGLSSLLSTAVVVVLRPDGPAAETTVRADLAGTWTGTVKDHYGNRATWTVELTLEEGEKVGRVRYPHARCTGKAVPVSYAGKSLIIRTDFPDEQSRCDAGNITLTRRKDGRADIVYYAPNQRTKKTTGTLRRTGKRP
ncbi:J domain-containing protein [Actinomadura sp. NAK00032]|uniref:J domain-containing protein n=1 Tax=Actinomadura sp. NAK00032 TaxID=2742128 RepID=UPI00159110BC|nr:J domain-containing protein [Actinomadura sp. NAK00032]QKW37651.1 J domain-containing protein [Actinomadura sp. NAK00032]